MPFIPHTESEIREMLDVIGVDSIHDLFDEIPEDLRTRALSLVPEGINEMEIGRVMTERANKDGLYVNFIGGGVYEHHIPAVVWELTTRGEFYSAYTPYQAEASQGTLQLLYEFQTMMARLTGLDVSNASLYDGASALAEAVLAAVRAQKKATKVLMPSTIAPVYRQVVNTIVRNQGIELVDLSFSEVGGHTPFELVSRQTTDHVAALVVPQPNYFGVLEDVDALTDWAHDHGLLVIGLVNPVAMALLKPPGLWGKQGADIAVGEGQPLGVPLSSGGPYFGFMCCKQKLIRQMPGRIVGRTVDTEGKPGYTLTLQAREQHIRRSKATSNICTNQGLMVTAATIYMALLGPDGLRRLAAQCHANTKHLLTTLADIEGVEKLFDRPFFHEGVLRLTQDPRAILKSLEAQGIVGGIDLSRHYPQLGYTMLVCATETRTDSDIHDYRTHLERIMSRRRLDPPCAQKVAGNV
jgi:glycine dehydrogenase subunit 1